MDILPVELVAIVCSFLEPRDIGRLRRASRFYAAACRPSMFRHLHLIFTPDSFKRLHAICSDPTLASFVTSLFYEADTLPFYECFDEWELHVFDRARFSKLASMHPPGSNSSERARRAYQRELTKLKKKPRHEYSAPQLDIAYKKYLAYSIEQDAMRRDDYNAGQIADALAQLPNLEEIILSLECWRNGRSRALENAHKDTYVVAYGDNSWTEPLGVPQMLSLLLGSAQKKLKLKSLYGGSVDWTFFWQSEEVFDELKNAVRNLREMVLEFSTGYEESVEGVLTFGVDIQECAEYLKNGRLQEFLDAAPNLRMLDLRFDCSNPNCPADLRYAVGTHKWEFLADATLGTFESRAEDLLGFCETHAKTLRRLVLNEIKLVEGSWSATFQKMRRLLRLTRVGICGNFEAFESDEYWSFTFIDSGEETILSRVVQRYLLKGGDGPLLDLSEYSEMTELEWEELFGQSHALSIMSVKLLVLTRPMNREGRPFEPVIAPGHPMKWLISGYIELMLTNRETLRV